MAQWPGPYTPGKASATVEINESVTTSSSLSGTNTMTGGPVSTSASFSTSASYDDSAYFNSVSPDGFTMSQPNAAGAIQNGSAQSDEIDTANGTDVNGAANASFSTSVTETATSSLYNTTDTTPASGAPVYTETDWRSMTTSTSETGSYTTSPPGGTPVTPTPNNPGAYAVFNEERNDFASVTNYATITWATTAATGGGGSESATGGYLGTANSDFTSHKETAAGPSDPAGSEEGTYTVAGDKRWHPLRGGYCRGSRMQ